MNQQARMDFSLQDNTSLLRLFGNGILQANRVRLHHPEYELQHLQTHQLEVVGTIRVTGAENKSSIMITNHNTSWSLSTDDTNRFCMYNQTYPVACVSQTGHLHTQRGIFGEVAADDSVNINSDLHIGKSTGEARLSLKSMNNGWAIETCSVDDGAEGKFHGLQVSNSESGSIPIRISSSAESDLVYINEDSFVGVGNKWPSVKLDVNGGVQGTSAYSSASDIRYKKSIRNISKSEALDKVLRLQGVHFQWRRDEYPHVDFGTGDTQVGLIAQAVENIVPQVVLTSDSEDGRKSVQYSGLIPLLIESIKALEQENREIRQRLDKLISDRL